MADKLGVDRAQRIRDAAMTDATFFMSDTWCKEHGVTREECATLLQYGVDHAAAIEWRESNLTVGAVEVPLTFSNHSGKVGDENEKWTVHAKQVDTNKILKVAETGEVIAQLFPKLMDDGGNYTLIDNSTGEVFDV